AEKTAQDWLAAWNAHDLEAILSHDDPAIVFTSPFVGPLTGGISGTLAGLEKLRDHFSKALAAYPDLAFRPVNVLAGVSSLVVYYESVGGRMSAELMELNPAGKIARVLAHDGPPR
ncbi:MAG TPA: nuclear transport factor 2 family protein, partial [bacterium]|nr:nuclear transport factor 2 family protein [bacterium]